MKTIVTFIPEQPEDLNNPLLGSWTLERIPTQPVQQLPEPAPAEAD